MPEQPLSKSPLQKLEAFRDLFCEGSAHRETVDEAITVFVSETARASNAKPFVAPSRPAKGGGSLIDL